MDVANSHKIDNIRGKLFTQNVRNFDFLSKIQCPKSDLKEDKYTMDPW